MDQHNGFSIQTGARLHFGLLDTREPYGGLGVMVDQPETTIVFRPGRRFDADDSIHDRALPIARRVARLLGSDHLPAVEISRTRAAPQHNGFGSGTQTSLAIAEGLCRWSGIDLDPVHLAVDVACRGKRSAVGIHGYFSGGLIYEDAEEERTGLNQVRRRTELPSAWRLLLIRRNTATQVVHGDSEKHKFSRLPAQPQRCEALRQLIVNRLLPAAESGNFVGFAESIQAYNRGSGMLFESVQGGPYNGSVVTDLIESLRSQGALGVGQSSWGPGVFCWCPDELSALRIKQKYPAEEYQCWITPVRNEGRIIRVLSKP